MHRPDKGEGKGAAMIGIGFLIPSLLSPLLCTTYRPNRKSYQISWTVANFDIYASL